MTRFVTRKSLVVFIFALVLATASSVFAVWTDPTDVPPNANTPAPLNTGATTQTKTGGLWAASMGTDNGFCIGLDCISAWSETISAGSVTTNTIENNAVTVEKTNFVGTLEDGQWCTVSGGEIVCTSDAPSGGGGITSCPSGWTMIGDSGKHATYCIETNERSSSTYINAKNTCSNINNATLGRAHLCTHNEWHTACMRGTGLSNMDNNMEWTADLDANGGFGGNFGAVIATGNGGEGPGGCGTLGVTAITNATQFRCCLR